MRRPRQGTSQQGRVVAGEKLKETRAEQSPLKTGPRRQGRSEYGRGTAQRESQVPELGQGFACRVLD